MSWFEKLFGPKEPSPPPPPPEHWLHVHIIEETRNIEDVKVLFYIHFYESNYGGRRIQVSSSYYNEEKAQTFTNQLFAYNKTARPWLTGRYDPDIPRYQDIPQVDLVKKLSE